MALSTAEAFLLGTVGEAGLGELLKFELYKPGTNTVVDHEELRTALQIVPRAVLSFLYHRLGPMSAGDHADIDLPVGEKGAVLRVDKHGPDVYSGTVEQGGKEVSRFKNRPLPGVGLTLMTAFEMYAPAAAAPELPPGMAEAVQRIVDERIASSGRPARPLAKFMATASARRRSAKAFQVEMAKGEEARCPDCRQVIFRGNKFSGCVCYGDDMRRGVKATRDGSTVRLEFSRGWDPENMSMLVDALRRGPRG